MSDLEIKLAPERDGEIVGYASLFNGPADAVGDIIVPGAYAASLKAGLPIMLREHKGQPVGEWLDVVEDDIGLKVRGAVTNPGTLADLRAGRLDGLSIGFIATQVDPIKGGRRLHEIRLDEISLVKRPASSRARVLSVKSHPAAAAAQSKENIMADIEAGGGMPTVEDRVNKLESGLDDVNKRLSALESNSTTQTKSLDRIETILRRPGAGDAGQRGNGGEVETHAFSTFLRHGRERLDLNEAKSLRVSDDTAGGFLAPDQFVAELLRNVVQFSPVRSVARVAPTAAGAVLLPKRTGGMTAQWVGETGARPETSVTFGQNRYPVAELAAYIDVSNAMLEDSAFDVAAELAFEFAEEFGKAEGTAFVNGSGPLKPLGFMQDAGLSFTVSGHASQVTADGLIQLFHDLPSAYRANGVWMMNSTTLGIVRKLKDGTSGQYLLLTQGIANAPATTLLGRPVLEAPDMPDVGAGNFPIVFGDFRQGYRVFDRVALSILRDPYSQATNGMTRFHGRRRVAGGVAKAEAVRKLKIST